MNLEDINFLSITIVNAVFLFLGIILNSLVIVVFWRNTQLRKKLSYFMIMVLSCCDLLSVVVNHPLNAILSAYLISKEFKIRPHWVSMTLEATSFFHLTSILALLVMNIDRYMAIFHPLYHKTKITKGKLLKLLGIMLLVNFVTLTMSINELVYSMEAYGVLASLFFMTPMLFINIKLFKISRKSVGAISTDHKKTRVNSSKHISSCLLAFASLMSFYVLTLVLGFSAVLVPQMKVTLNKFMLLWLKTIVTLNSTFNCLIFFWKNKLLRTEAMKFINTMKCDNAS